jgi:hypothetical protein
VSVLFVPSNLLPGRADRVLAAGSAAVGSLQVVLSTPKLFVRIYEHCSDMHLIAELATWFKRD